MGSLNLSSITIDGRNVISLSEPESGSVAILTIHEAAEFASAAESGVSFRGRHLEIMDDGSIRMLGRIEAPNKATLGVAQGLRLLVGHPPSSSQPGSVDVWN